MPFPNYPEKIHGTPVLTGRDMISYRRRAGRFPNFNAPESVIVCLETSLPKRMWWRFPYRKAGRFVGDLLMLYRSSGQVGIMVNLGVGAATVAALAEELIAWGTRKLILVSWAGVLQKDIRNGEVIVSNRAIRDEGTSHHYLAPEKYAYPDMELTSSLMRFLDEQDIAYRAGTTWSTDAPYRETKEEVSLYQSEDVLTVEMETAALFTLGKVHGIQTAAVFVAGDSLADQYWQPPTDIKAINQSFDSLYAALVGYLRKS